MISSLLSFPIFDPSSAIKCLILRSPLRRCDQRIRQMQHLFTESRPSCISRSDPKNSISSSLRRTLQQPRLLALIKPQTFEEYFSQNSYCCSALTQLRMSTVLSALSTRTLFRVILSFLLNQSLTSRRWALNCLSPCLACPCTMLIFQGSSSSISSLRVLTPDFLSQSSVHALKSSTGFYPSVCSCSSTASLKQFTRSSKRVFLKEKRSTYLHRPYLTIFRPKKVSIVFIQLAPFSYDIWSKASAASPVLLIST